MKLEHCQGFRLSFFKPTNTPNSYHKIVYFNFVQITGLYLPILWQSVPRRKIPNFLRLKVKIFSPSSALKSVWLIPCILLITQDLVSSQMTTGHQAVCGPGNPSSTTFSKKLNSIQCLLDKRSYYFLTASNVIKFLLTAISEAILQINWRVSKCITMSPFGVFADHVSVKLLPLTSGLSLQFIWKRQALKLRAIHNYWPFACHLMFYLK